MLIIVLLRRLSVHIGSLHPRLPWIRGERTHDDSLHRHPDAKAEDWYAYTDADIDTNLLGDYDYWTRQTRLQAEDNGDEERKSFHAKLQELNIDRLELKAELDDIKERMYVEKAERLIRAGMVGQRVQEQFDRTKKAWRAVDS